MKVTVEFTDEQADRIGNGRPGCESESMLRDAIVAARPKPLKVGDKVAFQATEDSIHDTYVAVAFGVHNDYRWMMVAKATGSEPWLARDLHRWVMPSGSPIVWPES